MALASPIYRASTGDTNRLYYRPEGGDYTQITGPSMLQNLAKAGQVEVGKAYQAYDPSASVAPQNTPSASSVVSTPVNTPSPVSTPTVGPLEQSPGVFKASALTDFYNNQISLMRPQYEAAQKQVQEINNQINNLKAPDYQSLYNTQYSQNVGQIDADLKATSEKLTGLDTTIRSLEDAVRQEVGGAASEAVIQAEVARRAKPLLLQRQTIVDQLGNLQSVKQNATQNIMQGLQFQQQSFQDSNALLDKRLSLAQSVQNSFNSLLEKGATATEKERDDFRSLFSTLLTNSPDVVRSLTEEETAQLRSGFLPASVMNKIGQTINEQKIKSQNEEKNKQQQASASQILNRAYQIQQLASDQGQSIDTQTAIQQARQEYATLNGGAMPDMGSYMNGNQTPQINSQSNALQIANAIKQVESSGNYNAKGGSGEFGAYQFMPSTWKSWAAQYLGNPNAEMTPANQDKVAQAKIQDLLNQGYSAKEIALIWNGGSPTVKKGTNKYGVAYDSGAYANKVMGALSKTNAALANAAGTPSSVKPSSNIQADTIFAPKDGTVDSKFTPQFYSTKLGQKTLDNEQQAKSRFESSPVVKDFVEVQGRVMEMENYINSGVKGPADVAEVYSFMKALDPNSVVRGEEYTAAASSGNIFSGIWARFNGYFKEGGGILPDNIRNDFLTLMNKSLESHTKAYNNYAKQTRSIAASQGLNPNNVAIEFNLNPIRSSSETGTKKDLSKYDKNQSTDDLIKYERKP